MKNSKLLKVICFSLMFMLVGSEARATKNAIKEVKVVCTAYYGPSPDQDEFVTGSYRKEVRLNGSGKLTKSNTVPASGTIAADPKIFPIGTTLYIPGYGLGVVEDTGKKIKGKRIDVFTGRGDAGLERAIAWGKRKITVKVIKKA
ncbi:MAG: 3D domain-containing protein [Candidatus Moraniibacteriota bacterium]